MKRARLLVLLLLLIFRQVHSQNCDPVITSKIVRGTSMAGIFSEGDMVTIAEGYFKCHIVERNTIVLVKWVGNEAPLLKRVVGLPGDRVRMENSHGQFLLLIEGELLRTTVGEPYLFDPNASRMLRVYIDSYRGVIPKETFIVLGNLPGGTMDSSRFGWVGRSMLIGKVLED